MTKKFEQMVIDHIRAYDMINPGDRIIVGVSGGRDSVCLLFLLNKLSKEWGFSLFAVHVNHMLRGEESERDKTFVKDLCKALNVPCMAVNTDVQAMAKAQRMSVEEAGRTARYKAFNSAARKLSRQSGTSYSKVALAHHRDDNVETILLNLARGTGINGLKGMMPVSEQGDLTVIRPLLAVGRSDLEKYVKDNKLVFVDDSSNFSEDYARNKIRLNVIPELQKVNSRASEHISEIAGTLSQVRDYMDGQISRAMNRIVDRRDDSIAIDIRLLSDEDDAIRTGIIHRSIGELAGTMKDITRIHVRDVISLADKQTGRRIELPYGLVASKSYDNIIIRREKAELNRSTRKDYDEQPVHMTMGSHINISLKEIEEEGGKTFIMADGGTLSFRIIEVNDENRADLTEKNLYNKVFDCDTIKGSLILGRPMPDDEIKFAGGTKSLKKYFTDEKIPWEIRNQLLVLKDLNSTLWVLGYRIGEPYKVTERTTRGLEVMITGGNDE